MKDVNAGMFITNWNNKNYVGVDITKFALSIVVVAIHIDPLYLLHDTVIWEIWMIIRRFAVPFFFMTTGYFLYKTYYANGCLDLSTTLHKKIKKFTKSYIIAMAVYTPLAIAFFKENNFGALKSSFYYLRGIVLWGEQHNSWQLWTILSTIYSLITMFFVVKLKKRCLRLVWSKLFFWE